MFRVPALLCAGLVAALRSPLGGRLGARSLTHLRTDDRLDELAFDLPLAAFDLARLAEVVLPHARRDPTIVGGELRAGRRAAG